MPSSDTEYTKEASVCCELSSTKTIGDAARNPMAAQATAISQLDPNAWSSATAGTRSRWK